MSADDTPPEPPDDERDDGPAEAGDIEPADVRAELDRQRRRPDGVEELDEGIVDLLSWALDTDTRARIYIQLRRRPHSSGEEVAEGTGLYPSTVREALSDLREDDVVERHTRPGETDGDQYEYTAIAPSELVGTVVEQVQEELNALFDLDRLLGGESDERDEPATRATDTDPVTITVEEADAEDTEADG